MNTPALKLLEEMNIAITNEGNKYWNISKEVGDFLSVLIKREKCKTGLEIGASTGFSTIHIALALGANEGKLTTVESSPKRIPLLENTISKSELKNIQILKGHAPEILLANKREQYDFVFIDATKYEYINYIKYLLDDSLNDKALIVADNIDSHREDLEQFIKYVDSHRQMKTTHNPIGTGLLICEYGK